ncbi:MAG: iron ABC transporter permease, partial [Nitrospinota bacterium]
MVLAKITQKVLQDKEDRLFEVRIPFASRHLLKIRRNSWRSLTRDPILLSLFIIIWGLLFLFIVFPLGALIWKIFFTEEGFTLGNLIKTVGHWQNRKALYDSLLLASLTASSGVLLGFLFAFTITRTHIHQVLKSFLNYIIIIPLISPPFLAAFSVVLAFGRQGIITRSLLGLRNVNIYGLPGTWIAETLTYFPTAVLVFIGVLQSINPNLEDAAFTLGDSKFGIFRKVTLPLAVPGIANAFLLVFAESLADFATPLILSGSRFPLLPVQAYLQVTGMYDMAGGATLAFMLLIPAFIVFVLQKYWVERRSRVSILGKPGRKTERRLVGKKMELLLAGACLSVVIFV